VTVFLQAALEIAGKFFPKADNLILLSQSDVQVLHFRLHPESLQETKQLSAERKGLFLRGQGGN
jgi:hypothetical protein